MSDETTQHPDLLNMPFEQREKYFRSQKVVDISNGLHGLIRNSDELLRLTVGGLLNGEPQARFPILGFNDGSIFILGGDNTRFEHRQIMLAKEFDVGDIAFATSIEGLNSTAPMPYLTAVSQGGIEFMESGQVLRLAIGYNTDLMAPRGTIARPGGHEILEKIFGHIDGVEIFTPDYYKHKD